VKILNGQDSCENNEQIMGKENNDFKTAKEGNVLFINMFLFCNFINLSNLFF
jgi:hypothetical protein